MPAISGPDQNILRTAPPVVEYYMAIVPQRVVFQASLNDAGADYGGRKLPYDNVTVGNYGNVEDGQTMFVYDSAMVYKGKVRVRKDVPTPPGPIAANTIWVSANNDTEWADDDILQVLDIWEPWAVPTFLDEDPDGTINYYKDTDLPWVDDDTSLPPKANGGVAFAGFLGSGGTVDVSFDASESFANATGATISVYLWDVKDGAIISGGVGTAAITVRFSNAAFRWITVTVTDSNGKTGIHRIPVWTFGGNYQPFTDFSIRRRTKDTRDGELQIEGFGTDVGQDDIYEGAGVVLFTITTIDGSTVTSDMACPFPGRQSIALTGWILKESVRWDPETGEASFTVGTLGKVADDMPGYPTFIKDVDSGDEESWHEGVDLTVRSIIFFLWRWHTNLTELAHMEIAPTDLIAGRKFPKAPPLKQVENALLMSRGVFARLGITRWGSLHIIYDPQELSDADRALRPVVLDMTSEDWTTELQISKDNRPRMSAILGGGIVYDGSDGTPYRGRSPGLVGQQSGRDARANNLIISSQSDLNAKLGALLAAQSDPWRPVTIENFYDVWEPTLQEYVTLTVAASDNPRGYEFDTDTKWIIRRVEVADVMGDTPTVRLTVERVVVPFEGVTVPIPDPPSYPPPPTYTPPEPWNPEPEEELGDGNYWVFGTRGGGVVVSKNFLSSARTFQQLNGGLGDTSIIESLAMCQARPSTHLVCIDGNNDVYLHTDWQSGGNWTSILTNAQASSTLGVGVNIDQKRAFLLKPTSAATYSYIFVLIQDDNPGPNWVTRILASDDYGSTWSVWPRPVGKFGTVGQCDFGNTQAFSFKKRSDAVSEAGGDMVVKFPSGTNTTGTIRMGMVGGATAPAFARSQYVNGDFTGWWEGIDTTRWRAIPPNCPAAGSSNLGGLGGGLLGNVSYKGPGAMCVSLIDNQIRMASVQDEGDPLTTVMRTGGDIVDGPWWGITPGAMWASPSYHYVGLRYDSGIPGTNLYLGSMGVAYTFNRAIRCGAAFPTLLDILGTGVATNELMVVGRSYNTIAEWAAGGADKDILWLSTDGGVSWSQIGSSLYDDYSVVAITDIWPDWKTTT